MPGLPRSKLRKAAGRGNDPSSSARPGQHHFILPHWFQRPDSAPFIMTRLDYLFLAITTSISIVTHLLGLGSPSNVVFDEVYFGNFTQHYYRHEYFFDIHPPLGKQLLYLGSRLSGYRYNELYSEIGAPLDTSQIRRLRFWPSITGSRRAPLMFATFKALGVSSWWSLAFGLCVATDQALIAESRLVLIDAYLSMFASFTILITAFIGRRVNDRKTLLKFVIAGGIAAGCTVSVKFTGGGVALTVFVALLMHYRTLAALNYTLVAGAFGFIVLISSFFAHFSMVYRVGPGCRYHLPSFCARLENGKIGKMEATLNLIPTMLASNFAITENHSYSSPWWSWPVLGGFGTYLWVKNDRQLWTIGSPVVWWGGTIGLIVWIVMAVRKPKEMLWSAWLIFGWSISYLPFGLIRRVMWNYHYFIPLLYSLAASAVVAQTIAPNAIGAPIVLIVGAAVCYWLYFPITYGTPIAHEALKKRMLSWWTY
jgi:dolichyl-phosphate-mannose-protein mannosyltransferase